MPTKKGKTARFQVDQVGDTEEVVVEDDHMLTTKSDAVHFTQYLEQVPAPLPDEGGVAPGEQLQELTQLWQEQRQGEAEAHHGAAA